VRKEALDYTGGDALDSTIAAAAAFRALNDNFAPRHGDGNLRAIAGYVFV